MITFGKEPNMNVISKELIKIDPSHLVSRQELHQKNVETILTSRVIQIVRDNYPNIIKNSDLKNKYIELLLNKGIDIKSDEFEKNLNQIFKNTFASNITNETNYMRDIRIDWYYGKFIDGKFKQVAAGINTKELPEDFSTVRKSGNYYFSKYNIIFYTEVEETTLIANVENIIDKNSLEYFNDDSLNLELETTTFTNISKLGKKKKRNVKIDFEKKNRKNSETGKRGELLVLKYERKKLIENGFADRVGDIKWVANDSDSTGYDIESFELIEGELKKIYIEVKTTTSKNDLGFFISKNELDFADANKPSFKLYRVWSLNSNPKLHIIGYDEFSDLSFEPISFHVS